MRDQSVAHRLRAIRTDKGYSVNDLCALVGCRPYTVNSLERGIRQPSRAFLRAVSFAMHVTEEWLATGEGLPDSPGSQPSPPPGAAFRGASPVTGVDIGERITEARLDLGLLKKDVAEELGCDPSLVSRYESSHQIPTRMGLRSLARILGVNEMWLEAGEGPRGRPRTPRPDPEPRTPAEPSPTTRLDAKGFGARLRIARESMGLSMEALGEQVGRNRSTIWRLERRGANPTLATASELARVLGVDVAWLVKGKTQDGR